MLKFRNCLFLPLLAAVALFGSLPVEAANAPNPPACPTLPDGTMTRQPMGAPTTPGGMPTPGSEYDTLLRAIDQIGLLIIPNASRLRTCLRQRLMDCTLCVNPSPTAANGLTWTDRRRGWGGDPIAISAALIGTAGAETPPVGGYGPSFCDLMLTLVSEAMHADAEILGPDGQPAPHTMATGKALEQAATTARKMILERCNRATGAYYQFLCAWIMELCARAVATPNAPADYDCPVATRRATSGAFGTTPTPSYGAVFTEDNTIYVMTARDDGSDRLVHTDVRHVTELVIYTDAPIVGQDTLLIIGCNQGEQVTQYQTMRFTSNGVLVSTSTKQTLSQRILTTAAHRDGDTRTHLYDRDAAEIIVYRDTNADGVPDTWDGVFASSGSIPQVQGSVTLLSPAQGVVLAARADVRTEIIDLNTEMLRLIDSDNNGVVNTSQAYLLKDETTIGTDFSRYPSPGDTVVVAIGTINHAVEVWLTDEFGVLLSQIGSGVIAYSNNSASIPISGGPLLEGEYVVLLDLDDDTQTAPHEVIEFP